MRNLRATMFATTAIVMLAPAAAMGQAGDRTCAEEVRAFIETVRQDQVFPQIEQAFAPWEERLLTATGEAEEDCFAVLADAQLALREAGVVVASASDEAAVARLQTIIASMETSERTAVAVETEPAKVAVQAREAEVAVEQEATDVDVAQRRAEVEVHQPQATVSVEQAQQRVDVTQPEAQVEVEAAAPQVAVSQPAPEVEVQQSQPEIQVSQTQPEVTIEQPKPEIVVRQYQPEVTIRQPKPKITVRQPEPVVRVAQPKPEVTVAAAKPQVEVMQAKPSVTVEQAKPEIQVTQRQPEVEVTQEEAKVSVQESRPEVQVRQDQAEVAVSQAEPQVEVSQAQPQVSVSQGQAEVEVSQDEATVATDLADGAQVTAMREEGGAEVSLQSEDAPEVATDETEEVAVRQAAVVGSAEAIAVREVEFGHDSARISANARNDVLMEVRDLVAEHPNAIIFLTGYASPIGDADHNQRLSDRRVEAVSEVLKNMGVPGDAIHVRSMGERNPEVPAGENTRSEENRRVEIQVAAQAQS